MKGNIAFWIVLVVFGIAVTLGYVGETQEMQTPQEAPTPLPAPNVSVETSSDVIVMSVYVVPQSEDYYQVTGAIKNINVIFAMDSIEITIKLFDENGDLIGSSHYYNDTTLLIPGDKYTFTELVETQHGKIEDNPCTQCEILVTGKSSISKK